MSGIGNSAWGLARWGTGSVPPVGPPVIEPLYPLDGDSDVSQSSPVLLRFTDDSLVNQATLSISVGPTVYVFGGVAQNGATLIVTPNAGNGFDVELRLPAAYPVNTTQQVVVYVQDDDSQDASLVYQFSVGISLRLVQVKNPAPNILVAYYNRPLRQDRLLSAPSTWKITPISKDAAPLEITDVLLDAVVPDTVFFRYAGGGSIYLISSLGIVDRDGNPIDPKFSTGIFNIFFPDDPPPDIRLFNSVFGIVGAVHQQRARLTIDNHVINRSIASATEVQRVLRTKQLDGTVGRDGRPGKNRI
jgi:hypothetical protein